MKSLLLLLFIFTGGLALADPAPVDLTPFIRTPPAPKTPRINGPEVYGERPGHPFLYHVPVTGDRPVTLSADTLPTGLTLDPATGNISGTVQQAGTYKVTFTARNALGQVSRTIAFVVGPQICLTPPMGWNSWNCFGPHIDEQKIRSAAEAMVKSGLIDHGWTYINMDDRWEGERDAQGRIQGSKDFPDLKGMADYIHGLGLKVGLYSSPGPFTCAGAVASYQHEDQDAQSYADWGMDYLKYDLCSYQENTINRRAEKFSAALPGSAAQIAQLLAKHRELSAEGARLPADRKLDVEQRKQISDEQHAVNDQLEAIYHQLDGHAAGLINNECDREPYQVMRNSLDKVNRDIVYSMCQYGIGAVWTWGAEVGGNTWRTTGDIGANWKSVEAHGFSQNGREAWAGPGHWNDPDMLEVGNGTLNPDENYAHMTLWCMLASPLLIGCDMTKMSPFTVSLFSNDEVLAVNQDSLGMQGYRLKENGTSDVWVKPLADGTRAVAFFNHGETPADIAVTWTDLGLQGKQPVRDLWRQKDLGAFDTQYPATVARHGAELFKIGQ